MSKGDLEVEETLLFADHHVERVLDIVWPHSGLIDAGDMVLQLDCVRIKRQAHLYIGQPSGVHRARLKVRVGISGLELKRQEKLLGEIAKETVVDSPWIRGAELYSQPETWRDLTAAFIKDRVSLCYRCKRQPKLEISIDRLTPLHTKTMQRLPATIWYCEIEGAHWVPPLRDHPVSERFWSALTAVASVAVEGEAKWELALASSKASGSDRLSEANGHWIDAVGEALCDQSVSVVSARLG
jgi:hypothetical protein